jgi:hypothetical protein
LGKKSARCSASESGEGIFRQPVIGVEEEDRVSLRAVASYIPATRDGPPGRTVAGDRSAMRTVAGAGVDDDDLVGPPVLPLYVREQSAR